jgi:hypothetical protein
MGSSKRVFSLATITSALSPGEAKPRLLPTNLELVVESIVALFVAVTVSSCPFAFR